MAVVDFQDGVTATALAATSPTFTLLGGKYGVTASATDWTAASAKLQVEPPDGAFVSVGADFTANGYVAVALPRGTYRITVAGPPAGLQFAVVPIRHNPTF